MATHRRRYTPQQQAQIVQRYREADPPVSLAAAAAAAKVHRETLRGWVRKAELALPTADPVAENRWLRAQLAEAQAERDDLRDRYGAERDLRLAYAATLRAFEEAAHA